MSVETTKRIVGNNFSDQLSFYSGLLKEQYQNLPPHQQNRLKYLAAAGGVGSCKNFFFFQIHF